MIRLLICALIVMGAAMGFTNMSTLENTYYDVTDAALDLKDDITGKANATFDEKVDKFVEPAREAAEMAESARQQAIQEQENVY